MSTTIFASHCHDLRGSGLPLPHVAKRPGHTPQRRREKKYPRLGQTLLDWRNDQPVALVLERVRRLGVVIKEPTLRSWEYGWIKRPDPLAIAALGQVYGKTSDDVLTALALDRPEIHLGTRTAEGGPSNNEARPPIDHRQEADDVTRRLIDTVIQVAAGLIESARVAEASITTGPDRTPTNQRSAS